MPDLEIEINGGIVVYELIGPADGDVVVLTPGGRYSKDHGGIRELVNALAEGGKRVLLWDRPNCGKSDIQICGRSESHMRAETMRLMLDKLGIDRFIAAGGSGGARDSILIALACPDKIQKLICWHIVGGNFSTISLAGSYTMNELRAVWSGGIEEVMKVTGSAGSWADLVAVNPRNADRLRAIGDAEFERVMQRWLDAFIPKPNEPIPGVPEYEFADIKVPTLIIRSGENDHSHPKQTSYEVFNLIKGSTLIEPPWPEDAWEQAHASVAAGTGNLFDFWVQGAPAMLEFMNR